MTHNEMKITVDNKTVVRVMLVAVGVLVSFSLLAQLEAVIRLVIMAMFLAMALNPPVSYLASRMKKGGRPLATAISYTIVLIILGLFMSIIVPPFARETGKFIDQIPNIVTDISTGEGFLPDLVERFDLTKTVDELSANVTKVLTSANTTIINGLGAVGTFIFTLVTVLVLAFFMLVEGPKWIESFWEAQSPNREKHYRPLINKMYGVVTSYVNGQFLIATIASMTSLVAMLLVGIAYPLPLATLVFLFGLVPLVGATLGSIAVITVALFKSVFAAVVMAIFFIVYQQIENNVLQPYVQSKTLDVSPLTVLVAVLSGVVIAGPLGGFIAIPVAASIRILILDRHAMNVARRTAVK